MAQGSGLGGPAQAQAWGAPLPRHLVSVLRRKCGNFEVCQSRLAFHVLGKTNEFYMLKLCPILFNTIPHFSAFVRFVQTQSVTPPGSRETVSYFLFFVNFPFSSLSFWHFLFLFPASFSHETVPVSFLYFLFFFF